MSQKGHTGSLFQGRETCFSREESGIDAILNAPGQGLWELATGSLFLCVCVTVSKGSTPRQSNADPFFQVCHPATDSVSCHV